jgi:hypothetical protein
MRLRVIGASRPRSVRQAAQEGLLRPPPPRAAPPAWQHTEQWSAVPRPISTQRSAAVPAPAGAVGWGPRLSVKSPPPPWLLGASHSQPPQTPLNARTEEDWDAWAHAGELQVRATFASASAASHRLRDRRLTTYITHRTYATDCSNVCHSHLVLGGGEGAGASGSASNNQLDVPECGTSVL